MTIFEKIQKGELTRKAFDDEASKIANMILDCEIPEEGIIIEP